MQDNQPLNISQAMLLRMQQQQNQNITFGDIFRLCFSNWYWFLICTLISCGLATAYILRTPKVYSRQAAIQIKENGSGNKSLTGQLTNAAEMGMFDVKSSVNNELVAIQSPALVLEAAKRLHLEYTYMVAGTFHKNTVYGSSLPIQTEVQDLNDSNTVSFELTLSPDNQVILSNFKKNGQQTPSQTPVKGMLGSTLETPLGKIDVMPSSYPAQLTQSQTYYISRNTMLGALNASKAKLSASLENKQADIINLTYTDVNIQRAEEFLNMLIGVYNENWIKDKNQIAVSTSRFIGERLAVIEEELGNVDNNISTFKSENLLPDLDAASSMALSEATRANSNITLLNSQLYMARQVRSYVSDGTKQNELLPANSGIEDPSIEKQIAEYNSQLLQRNSLVANSSVKNPLVQDMDAKLRDMRNTIVGSMDNVIKNINSQIRGQQSVRNQSTGQLASNPNQAKYLLSVERQQKVKESLYLFLLQKREENELSQAFTAYNTRLITPPMGSNTPTAPATQKIILIALMAGLAVPFILLYLIENNNTSVRNRKDLDKMITPFVGEIPMYGKLGNRFRKINRKKMKGVDNEIREVVVKNGCRNIINEAFRVVRANMEFMVPNGDTPVVMVLSSVPGSGKTFVSGNLGAAFSLKDKKIVLVDMDMRKPTLSNAVGSPESGLAGYLAGKIEDWRPLLRKTATLQMDLLPVGIIPPNPTELLYSDRLQQLITDLKSEYDLVILDCPPAEVVADASIIAKHANMTLFLIRSGLLHRDMLPTIDNYYKEKKFPNMALVLNGTEVNHGRYGYGYGHGYGYGYGSYTKE